MHASPTGAGRVSSAKSCTKPLKKKHVTIDCTDLYNVLFTAISSGMTTNLPVVMCVLQNRQIPCQVLVLPAMQQLLNRRVAVQGILPAGHAICDWVQHVHRCGRGDELDEIVCAS